jgi:hypothetical protein
MPLTTETVIVDMFDLSGGWVPDASQYSLQPNELVEAENVEYDVRGGFRVRAGYDLVANTGVTFMHAGTFTEEDGDHHVVAISADGSIFDDTDITLVDSTSNLAAYIIGTDDDREYDVSMTQMGDYFYVASRRGNTWRFDGTTWVEITDTTLNGTGTAGTPEFPQAKSILTLHNRVFAANVFHDAADYPSRLVWSTLSAGSGQEGGNRFEATAFVDINEADGSQIQAIAPFQSTIVVFKDDSLWVMAGDDEDNFTLMPIDPTVGTRMSGSIASDQSVMFFLDQGSGVYVFDGVQANRIDEQINADIMATISAFQADKLFANGWIEDHKYFLCVGQMDGNKETYVYDMRLNAWSHWDLTWTDIFSYRDVTYMIGKDGISSFRDRTFLDDDATAVDWSVKTAWVPAAEGQDMRQYRVRRVDVHSQWVTGGSASYSFDMYADNNDTTPVWTNTAQGDVAQERFPGYDGLIYRVLFHAYGTNSAATQTDRRVQGISLKLSARPSKGSFAANLDATLPTQRTDFPCFDGPEIIASSHVEDTATLTLPADGADGDLLVIIASRANATAVSVPAGYSLALDSGTGVGDNRSIGVFYKAVTTWASESAPTLSAAVDHGVMVTIRNANTYPFVASDSIHYENTLVDFVAPDIPGGNGQIAFRIMWATATATVTHSGGATALSPGPVTTDTGSALFLWEVLGDVDTTAEYTFEYSGSAFDVSAATVVFSG